MPSEVFVKPSEVSASRGKVREAKPDGSAVEFTAEAALQTANRLTEAAIEAKGIESRRDDS